MTLSIGDISDRIAIQDLLLAYCDAIDRKNFDALDDIFTADADIDYTEAGGAKGKFPEIKLYLERALEKFPSMQHMIGMPQLTISGDQAEARTMCFNPMVVDVDGQTQVFFVGLWYCDTLIRIHEGWRINSRREEVSYFHNLPEAFKPVDV